MCDLCKCLARGGWEVFGCQDWVWALPILEEHGENGKCVCVLVAVVWLVLGESGWAAWARVLEGGVVLCLCVCCESGLYVLMAGPGICILC